MIVEENKEVYINGEVLLSDYIVEKKSQLPDLVRVEIPYNIDCLADDKKNSERNRLRLIFKNLINTTDVMNDKSITIERAYIVVGIAHFFQICVRALKNSWVNLINTIKFLSIYDNGLYTEYNKVKVKIYELYEKILGII